MAEAPKLQWTKFQVLSVKFWVFLDIFVEVPYFYQKSPLRLALINNKELK